jgi:hypothetical protein
MAQFAHPDFQSSRQFRPRRPNLLRRTARRYQIVELFVIIGAILLLWGGASLGTIHAALNGTPPGWVDSMWTDVIDRDSLRGSKALP